MPILQTNDQEAPESPGLRKRLTAFYKAFNREDWKRCFAFVDPELRTSLRVEIQPYSASLLRFFEQHGPIRRIFTKLEFHLAVTTNKHDDRPFAYAVIVWQDRRHAFHLFRERWVKDGGLWYTRVVGLVAHAQANHQPGEADSAHA